MIGSRRFGRPRGELRDGRREFTVGMGVRYGIPYDDTVHTFFGDLADAWGSIVAPQEVPARRRIRGTRQYDRFRIYDRTAHDDRYGSTEAVEVGNERDDERFMGRLTIAELRIGGGEGDRKRLHWSADDAARTEVEILDALAGLRQKAGLKLGPLALTLTHAVPVGEQRGRGGGRKFALVPEAADPTAIYLTEAHEVTIAILSDRLRPKNRRGTNRMTVEPLAQANWMPHLTVGYIFKDVPRTQVATCAGALSDLLAERPLDVVLAKEQAYTYSSYQQAAGF